MDNVGLTDEGVGILGNAGWVSLTGAELGRIGVGTIGDGDETGPEVLLMEGEQVVGVSWGWTNKLFLENDVGIAVTVPFSGTILVAACVADGNTTGFCGSTGECT